MLQDLQRANEAFPARRKEPGIPLEPCTLRELGYTNVTVRQGDGYKGWPEQAPFDRIILTAAPPAVPETLVAQLSSGGRLVAPVGQTWNQELIVIEKKADGRIQRRSMGAVSFVPMKPGAK